ncbi:MAG: class I SAM-dependent methyltransferase [Hyphomicrobiaceae bacterium]|nr:class I SAM-dependent methyltransferase [Hyphomicrobiaceae bacterium]
MSKRSYSEAACDLSELTPEVYAGWRASELGAMTEQLERRLMLESMGDVRGKDILEIGCGDGELSVRLALQGGRVAAIDVSEEMLAAARRRAEGEGADVVFAQGGAEQIPFASGSFDVVVAMTILCFVEEAAPVFQEMARVLKPGGRIVIGELGKRSTWAAARRVRAWLGSRLWRAGVFRTPAELEHLAASAGLLPIDVRGSVYYPPVAWIARLVAPCDAWLGRTTTVGAAFLRLEARKPPAPYCQREARDGAMSRGVPSHVNRSTSP